MASLEAAPAPHNWEDVSLAEARARVVAACARRGPVGAPEAVAAEDAVGRILAMDAAADRDFPPWPRAARDGYALRAADVAEPGRALRRIGLARAGAPFAGSVGPGECVEIMTGAPAPEGADAVIMVERSRSEGDQITFAAAARPGDNIAPAASEARGGDALLRRGERVDYAGLAVLAATGLARPLVFSRPRVAVLASGDELADAFGAPPRGARIRNSNALALAAQCRRAGAEAEVGAIIPDRPGAARTALERALEAHDLALISGGVSRGRFDFVKPEMDALLAARGGEWLFQSARLRPGHPVAAARVAGPRGDQFLFGLPGNPLSAMLCCELFARPAVALLSGAAPAAAAQAFVAAEMGFHYRAKPLPLTFFLPVRREGDLRRALLRPVPYRGSADLAALAAADGYLVVPEGCAELAAGSIVDWLPK